MWFMEKGIDKVRDYDEKEIFVSYKMMSLLLGYELHDMPINSPAIFTYNILRINIDNLIG